jgi:hypothetical protein
MKTSLISMLALMLIVASGCRDLGERPVPTTETAMAERVLAAQVFGVRADGTGDDGPAIACLLAAAKAETGPVRIVFPENSQVRVTTAPERYVFRLDHAADVTVDGQGCTFLLGPDVRFLRLRNSERISIRNLNVDFEPLPFVDGMVQRVEAAPGSIDVAVPTDEIPRLLGGPTKKDGEQAFFAMLWWQGAYGLVSRHYWVERMERGPTPNTVRVFAGKSFRQFGDIKPGEWRISLPVPGIAHRYGPGACGEILDNGSVAMADVELWAAPWFGFRVIRNHGPVTFRRVNIRPKSGTGRLTSAWRDGFHVKGNRGPLLWEDCILEGMNDDAFNISHHCSRVRKILSPTKVEVLQAFPLTPMPWYVGDRLVAADFDTRTLLGEARIVHVTGWTTERRLHDRPAASPVTVELDRPIPGLTTGTMVSSPESANPATTLRRCTIRKSCRLQSPVVLDACDVTALLWFYGEKIEGPFPSHVTVRDCILRRGRGNPRLAVSFAGRLGETDRPSAIHDVLFERNEVWGDLSMIGVDRARLLHNTFPEPGAEVRIEDCPGLERR